MIITYSVGGEGGSTNEYRGKNGELHFSCGKWKGRTMSNVSLYVFLNRKKCIGSQSL